MSTFSGFPATSFAYLADLRDNNNRPWFTAHKTRYETDCLTPALDFIAALAPHVAGFDPPHIAQPKMNGSLRRLHRDVRFSNDKTPYNPRLHFIFWAGDHPNRAPALHFVLGPDSFGLGVGQWGWDAAQLSAYRAAIAHPDSRATLKAALQSAQDVGCDIEPASLKRLPKECASLGADDYLLLRKSLIVRTQHSLPIPVALCSPAAVDYAIDLLRAMLPLSAWLVRHIA